MHQLIFAGIFELEINFNQLARKFNISELLDDQKSSLKIIFDDHGDVYFPKI